MQRFDILSRRNLLQLGSSLATTGSLLKGSMLYAQEPQWAQGIVFEAKTDANERQYGDPGIPGVLVSNGRDVVRTDADGHYRLPVWDGAPIFVIKPRGWIVPLDPVTRLPRHYYIHSPFGTPVPLTYRGLDATGDLPSQIDFPLRRAAEEASFSVLMLADPQPSNRLELDYLRELVISGIDGQFAFGLTLGDIMSDDLSLYGPYNRLLGQLGLPLWNLPGNHDLNLDAGSASFARETWKRVYGPPCHALEYANALFILLDNVQVVPSTTKGYGYRGHIGRDQLAFVKSLLSYTPHDMLIVLAMHIPLVSALDRSDASSNTDDTKRLLEILGDRPCVSFSGHMHTTEHHYLGPEDGCHASRPHHHHVLTAVSGSWWSGPLDPRGLPMAQSCDGSPNGYHVLEVNELEYTTRFVAAREPSQMRLLLTTAQPRASGMEQCLMSGQSVAACDLSSAQLLVNVFDGGPRTGVSWTLDGKAMAQPISKARVDPLTKDLFARAGSTLKPWVKAEVSSHIWEVDIPYDLEPGLHRISVNVDDAYGRPHRQNLIFEVTAT